MIKSITVTNHMGESIKLELTRPEKSGFIVLNAEGLVEPVKANINTSKVAATDGALYNSAYLDVRDITLELQYLESSDETAEDIRLKSYKYFPEKRRIRIVTETDRRIVETYGYVEHNKPTVFSDSVGSTITILCEDPYLYNATPNITLFSGVTPKFHFPFSNASTTEPELIFGEIYRHTEAVIYYDGDSEVGVYINIHAVGDVTNLTIHNVSSRQKMTIDTTKLAKLTGSGIIAGDNIVIETSRNKKKITLTRDGVDINIMNCLDRGTDWITLTKGDNIIAYTADVGNTDLQFTVTNKIAYEGA